MPVFTENIIKKIQIPLVFVLQQGDFPARHKLNILYHVKFIVEVCLHLDGAYGALLNLGEHPTSSFRSHFGAIESACIAVPNNAIQDNAQFIADRWMGLNEA